MTEKNETERTRGYWDRAAGSYGNEGAGVSSLPS